MTIKPGTSCNVIHRKGAVRSHEDWAVARKSSVRDVQHKKIKNTLNRCTEVIYVFGIRIGMMQSMPIPILLRRGKSWISLREGSVARKLRRKENKWPQWLPCPNL